MQHYPQNLDNFVKQLPNSTVRFLYFVKANYTSETVKKGDWIPTLSRTSKKWIEHGLNRSPLYIVAGEQGSGKLYVYDESGLKNGNHYTICFEDSCEDFCNELRIATHTTRYVPLKSHHSKFKRIEDDEVEEIVQSTYRNTVATFFRENRAHAPEFNDGRNIYAHDGFTRSFIKFIQDFYIIPCSHETPKLVEVILVDEEESDHVLIRYNEDHGDGIDIEHIISTTKTIPKIMVFDAFTTFMVSVQ